MSECMPNDGHRISPVRDGGTTTPGPVNLLEVLWETAGVLRGQKTADDTLRVVAEGIARAGLYERAVLTLHNKQGDITAVGYHGLPDEVIAAARRASRVPAEKRRAILDSANLISESYFIPAELGVDLTSEGRYVKSSDISPSGGTWLPEDQLFVPIRDSQRAVIGYASVDTPVDGQRPTPTVIHHLELFVHLAETALLRIRDSDARKGNGVRLERLMTTTGDVVFHVDFTTDTVVYINAAVGKLLGYPAEYFLSQPVEKLFKMFIAPEDRGKVWPDQTQVRLALQSGREQSAEIEFRVRRKDGEIRKVRGIRTIIYDDDGRAVAAEGIVRDISDQDALRQQLAVSEDKYQHLAKNTQDLVYVRDLEDRLLCISPAVRCFWGVDPEAAITTKFADWLADTPANRAVFEVSHTAIVQGERISPYTVQMCDHSGRTFFVELDEIAVRNSRGVIVAVQGIGRRLEGPGYRQTELEKSERKFRELADLLPQTVYEIDLNLNLTYTNRQGMVIFGYAPEDLAHGLNAKQLFVPGDESRMRENLRQTIERGMSPGNEYTAVRKDGSTFPALLYSSPIVADGKPVGLRGVLFDLTDRKSAEKAIREQESRYRNLFENSPITMFEEDWTKVREHINYLRSTGVTDLRAYFAECPQELVHCRSLIELIGVNKAALKRFGAASFADLRSALKTITTPESFTALGRVIVALEEGQTVYSGEDSARRLDGRIMHSNVRLSIVPGHEHDWSRIIVSVIDVTEQKQAADQLRQDRDFIHALLDTANSLIFCLDSQARITVFNKELERVTGYTRDEVVGKHWPEIFLPPGPRPFTHENFGDWVRQHPRDSYEGPLVTKSGEIKTILWSNSALFSAESDEITAMAVGQDITDRKRIERALLESELRYHELFNSVMEGIAILDDGEVIQFCNPAFARIFGAGEPHRLIGRNLLEFVPQDQHGLIAAETRKRRRGENSQYELEIITPADERKTIWAAVAPRIDYTGKYLGAFGAVLDITERKKAEEAVRRSEEQFRTFAENIPGVVCIYDEYPDGRRESVYIGPGLEELLGKALAEKIGNSITAFMGLIVPDDLVHLQKASEEALSSNGILDFEYRIQISPERCKWLRVICRASRRHDGSVRWEGQGFDVTDRKEALDALRSSEETSRALLNATHDSVLLVKLDGTVIAANDTAINTLGAHSPQFVGSNVFDVIPPAVAEMRKAHGRNVVQTGQPGRFQDERAGKKFDYTIYPIFGRLGDVERLAIFARDVTEREKMLQKLREKSAELDRANAALEDVVAELRRKHERARELSEKYQAKNEELEALVSMISHDLKTPLISIHELTGLFRRRYARLIDEGGQGLARRISTNAAQMLRLVESLLDYSRVPECFIENDEAELGVLIDDIWDQVTDAFPGRRPLLRRPNGPQTLRCSRMALERILLNLLRNAVAYVPEDRRPMVTVDWSLADDAVTLTIGDNGCGIPPDEQERIFELFYRVQPAATEGSGIGLAVVKKIIDAVHGTIALSSTPGEGTVFTIRLPRSTVG